MSKRIAAVAVVAFAGATMSSQAAVVGVDPSTANWLGFMNVFDLPSAGGGFVFPSPWGVSDLRASFDDANGKLTFKPATISTSDAFWYQGGSGGPGALGNKIMEANLYQQKSDGSLSGTTVTFNGTVLSNSLASGYSAFLFIRDFAPDFSSLNQAIIPLSVGSFSFSLNTAAGVGRNVQWGIQVVGPNLWPTDGDNFGKVVLALIPAPGTAALGTMGLLLAARRRR